MITDEHNFCCKANIPAITRLRVNAFQRKRLLFAFFMPMIIIVHVLFPSWLKVKNFILFLFIIFLVEWKAPHRITTLEKRSTSQHPKAQLILRQRNLQFFFLQLFCPDYFCLCVSEIAQPKHRRLSRQIQGEEVPVGNNENSRQTLLELSEIYVKQSTVPYNQRERASWYWVSLRSS